MPDLIDANGLQTKTLTEITTELITNLKTIYGVDINVESNSPNGQEANIYSQGGVDLREVLTQINANFDPDQAQGKLLDQRVALNGLKRNLGSYTFQNIEITIDRALNLVGLDGDADILEPDIENLYTVKDDEGNEFYLLASQSEAGAGTYTYTFRAAELGQIETLPSTITTQVSIIPGVTNVNNPSGPNSVGENEETDNELKIRRKASTALSSRGYLDVIEAAILNLDTVSTALVYENDTNVTDSNGIPPKSIWAIVEGGDPDEIAQTIYAKKSAGCGMKGTQTVTIIRPQGQPIVIRWDNPVNQDLYMRFTVTPTLAASEITALKSYIVANLFWTIGGDSSNDEIVCFVKDYLGSGYKVLSCEVSTNGSTWFETVTPTALNYRFQNDIGRITIL